MSFTYKKIKDFNGNVSTTSILRKEDMLYIPKDESNRHYQEYLEWAKTNTAEPAD